MSSTPGANASGRKSELKDSTGANPFGSGFGSGHALTPDRSGLRCVGPSALSAPAVGTLLSSRMRLRASIDTCVASSMQIDPYGHQELHLDRCPCSGDVGLEFLQA